MRETLKRLIDACPPAGRLARSTRALCYSVELRLGSTASDRLRLRHRRFERAFRTGAWTGTGESVSGDGSSLAATKKLRAALPSALEELGVTTLLDVPCGDWHWMSEVDLPIERYIGGDIVTPLVRRNQERFSNPRRTFQVIDLCTDELPSADLLLCRDALIHFSYADIWRALANVKDARITYLAATTFPETITNTDQVTGIPWRHLNLEAAPFSFPLPFMRISDDFNRADQVLGFWQVRNLPDGSAQAGC